MKTSKQPVRVLVCRVGLAPVVEVLSYNERDRSHYDGMVAIVEGIVTVLGLDDGLSLWSNDEALIYGLPLNRVFDAAPRAPLGGIWADAAIMYVEDDDAPLARPGEPGQWRIHGNFFLSREDDEGEIASVTDEDIVKYTALCEEQDRRAIQMINRVSESRSFPFTIQDVLDHKHRSRR